MIIIKIIMSLSTITVNPPHPSSLLASCSCRNPACVCVCVCLFLFLIGCTLRLNLHVALLTLLKAHVNTSATASMMQETSPELGWRHNTPDLSLSDATSQATASTAGSHLSAARQSGRPSGEGTVGFMLSMHSEPSSQRQSEGSFDSVRCWHAGLGCCFTPPLFQYPFAFVVLNYTVFRVRFHEGVFVQAQIHSRHKPVAGHCGPAAACTFRRTVNPQLR